jgi:hypothetical protein
MLLTGLCPALAQDFITARQVTMVGDDKASLTSEKKELLSMSVSGRAFSSAVFLPAQTPVKVLSRQTFVKRESVGVTAQQVNRTFTVAMIEVLAGDHAGEKGWAVIDVQDAGSGKDVYIVPGRASAASSQAGQSSDGSPDLVVSVGAGHISPTGGRLYEVGVVNKGGQTYKGSIEVQIEIQGKPAKIERLRGPLEPGHAVSVTLPASDSDLRKRVQIKATVDPRNVVKEADESNNTSVTTASP